MTKRSLENIELDTELDTKKNIQSNILYIENILMAIFPFLKKEDRPNIWRVCKTWNKYIYCVDPEDSYIKLLNRDEQKATFLYEYYNFDPQKIMYSISRYIVQIQEKYNNLWKQKNTLKKITRQLTCLKKNEVNDKDWDLLSQYMISFKKTYGDTNDTKRITFEENEDIVHFFSKVHFVFRSQDTRDYINKLIRGFVEKSLEYKKYLELYPRKSNKNEVNTNLIKDKNEWHRYFKLFSTVCYDDTDDKIGLYCNSTEIYRIYKNGGNIQISNDIDDLLKKLRVTLIIEDIEFRRTFYLGDSCKDWETLNFRSFGFSQDEYLREEYDIDPIHVFYEKN